MFSNSDFLVTGGQMRVFRKLKMRSIRLIKMGPLPRKNDEKFFRR